MARRTPAWSNPRTLLGVAILILAITSMLPNDLRGWESPVAYPANMLLAPLRQLLHRTFGSETSTASRESANAALVEEIERLRYEKLNALDQLQRWEEQHAEFVSMMGVNREVPRLVRAPVIGGGRTSLQVKAGSRDGVEVNSIVVVNGVDLLGRVTEVLPSYCYARPFTAKTKGAISLQGVVMLGENTEGPVTRLTPTGDGTVEGRVEFKRGADGEGEQVAVGMVVRLKDTSYPASAQMFILGVVEKVGPVRDQPQRQFIVVRPRITLERATEVILRIPKTTAGGSGSGGGAP